MLKKYIVSVFMLAAAFCFAKNLVSQEGATSGSKTRDAADAAQRFLQMLDENQRKQTVFDFNDDEQRRRWSNLPQSAFRRTGSRLGDLTQAQRDAVWALLKITLSEQGYQKVFEIVEADEALRNQDSGRGGRGRGGAGSNFGRDNYFVSFVGNPSSSDPWTLQFGGHHLGINVTFVGDKGTLSPSHTGAQPATFEFEGKTVRPLGREVDKSFALLHSLDELQRKQAILGFAMRDLVLGPGRDGQMIEPEGIKGDKLTEQQRTMLLDLASEWTGIMHTAAASAKMEEMKKDINETWFAWAGPTERGSAAYFRIHGPTVFIEFSPQRLGGDPLRHIHTIYRDQKNEYGKGWWKR